MNVRAVVPAKGFARAKTRLAPVLDAASRAALAKAMLEHVLDALAASGAVGDVVVVTDADDVEALAVARGAACVRDAGEPPLSIAVDAGLEAVRQRPHASTLVIMADLPLLAAQDVRQLVAALVEADVVIAPDTGGRGTNALALAPHVQLPNRFGTGDSFTAHRDEAEQRGLRVSVHVSQGTACDVDLPTDLALARSLKREAPWLLGRSGNVHRA